MRYFSFSILLTLLGGAACRPDAAPADFATNPPTTAPVMATPAYPTDTLHLPAGVVQLLPASAEVFDHLPGSSLPKLTNNSGAEPLAATQGQVRRQGLDLLLPTEQRTDVKLSSTPDAEFTLENGDGVRYLYWGSLPATHQWVVKAWFWESDATVLVDQRTGRRLEVPGTPVSSADGRFVVLTSPGLSGGDQPNVLSLVAIEADGPHLRWQREPTAWEPQEVRWKNPGVAILKLRRADASGSVFDAAPDAYVELPLPR